MKIKWWGHSSFSITTDSGTKILTDPYNEELPYCSITDEVDIVTVSHGHYDHNAVDELSGEPEVVDSLAGFKDENVKIEGIASYHDDNTGNDRGDNIIFLFELEGKTICHCGDLGHLLDSEQLDSLGEVDILLIPVGGTYTIDAEQAYEVVQQIDPMVIIPMHYKTDILDFPITGVDNFTSKFKKEQIKKFNTAEIKIENLPSTQTIYLPDYVR